ncbi:MAG: hypothetical protein ACE5JU_21260 [Candidatus Binatia bacterium]
MAGKLYPSEDLFVNIFTALYGEQHRSYLLKYHNLPFSDTGGGPRFMDFALFLSDKKVAIEIEGETYHNPALVESSKYSDDLLRANAQIIAGWTRLSFTPRALFENVELVKKQLREVLGETPLLIDPSPSSLASSLVANLPLQTPSRQSESVMSGRAENLIETEPYRSYALAKMRPTMSEATPDSHSILDYSLARNVPYISDFANEIRLSKRQEAIDDLRRRHPEPFNDTLNAVLKSFPLFSIGAINDWHVENTRLLEPVATSRERAFRFVENLLNSLYGLNMALKDEALNPQRQDIFAKDRAILGYATAQLAAIISTVSAAFLSQRQAIIAIKDGRVSKVLLNKRQVNVGMNGFSFPNSFYESCVDELIYLQLLPPSVLNRLLMGDSLFNSSSDQPCSMPAEPAELTGHLQDTVYLCFNHGLVNRYYVEVEPCEFIIQSYNIKSITLYEQPANNGIIILWFKIKYTDESVELGMIILDPRHNCKRQNCPLKKYELQFYVEYNTNKTLSKCNVGKFVNSARNIAKIMPIIAACYRDLNVLEVETKSYSKSRKQVLRPLSDKGRKEYWTKVVWVPRKKVVYERERLKSDAPQFRKNIDQLIPTLIMGHLRRCENPNPKQLELAKEFGITPPFGYTFVRPHSRHIHKAELTRYRSKSALEILYGQVE